MKSRRSLTQNRTRNGFTLIEVLLVLIILVIIGALASRVFIGTQDRASIKAATSNLSIVSGAINEYRLEMNKYPSKLADLWEKPSDQAMAEKWGSKYLEKMKPDPWGNEYQYLAEGKKNSDKYDLWSNGPDGKSGTEDDIGNWE
ncbi:type II secretion system major pseudopilin GspG [Adhaeretor mobilis]|uniref:Type II secretion system core protein G n=1 Tax=Adhaeretor mobilis TaxID=1930276 RepID=A0A517MUM9_9BACT|nr:type II secretion system major pseudopilin GspG [Adhaeretor mobilis]QDS98595.1 Type II secretion system protein G precursor [Adhaeretor mobilis]